jgi:hypothetical protein
MVRVALLAWVIPVAACADTVIPVPVSTTQLTAADMAMDEVASRVEKARCFRAKQCNRVGAGQMYVDDDECAAREQAAAARFDASCAGRVDSERLDTCLANLEDQYCDADLGPVQAFSECRSYCAR